jgi:flagellar basal body rod protein FlgB
LQPWSITSPSVRWPSYYLFGSGSAGLGFSVYATPCQTHLDTNTADMDLECASFAESAIKYGSTLRFVNAPVRTMPTP